MMIFRRVVVRWVWCRDKRISEKLGALKSSCRMKMGWLGKNQDWAAPPLKVATRCYNSRKTHFSSGR